MWNIPETLPAAYLNIPVTTPKLPVNPNGNWDKLSGDRDINKLSHIVLHHDGMAKSRFLDVSDDELMKRIANNHIRLTSNHELGERSEEHTSELQSRENLVCRLLLEKKKKQN